MVNAHYVVFHFALNLRCLGLHPYYIVYIRSYTTCVVHYCDQVSSIPYSFYTYVDYSISTLTLLPILTHYIGHYTSSSQFRALTSRGSILH